MPTAYATITARPPVTYDSDYHIGLIPWDSSLITRTQNTQKLSAALQNMWYGGMFEFAHGEPGPVLFAISFPGNTYYFLPPIVTGTRIGAALYGAGGSGYEMLTPQYTADNGIGGMRTRLIGVNESGDEEPVLRVRCSGLEIYGMDIFGREMTDWSSNGPKAISCIQMEGSATRNPGRMTVQNCGLYESTYGIQTLSGYYDDDGDFVSDENHADLGTVQNVEFFNVNSCFRSENQQSIGWNFRRIFLETVGNNPPQDTIVFDVVRGGDLTADSIIINHGRSTVLRIRDYSPHQSSFDIQNIYRDRSPVVAPQDYLTLVRHDGVGAYDWRIRMSGMIGESDLTRYDSTRSLDINANYALDTSNMYFDIMNLPTDEFLVAGDGPYVRHDPTTGPLRIEIISTSAHYPLDESSGTTAYERMGAAPDGTVSGGPAWVAGKVGTHVDRPYGALDFSGVSSAYVSIPDDASIHLYTGSSIAFWVYLNAWSNGCIVSKTGSALSGFRTEASPNHFYVSEAVSNKLDFVTYGFASGAWHHIALTLDSSGTPNYKAFLDGALVNTGTMTGGSWLGEAIPLRIGAPTATFYGSGTAASNMIIDDVRCYKRVLSENAVAELYSMGS